MYSTTNITRIFFYRELSKEMNSRFHKCNNFNEMGPVCASQWLWFSIPLRLPFWILQAFSWKKDAFFILKSLIQPCNHPFTLKFPLSPKNTWLKTFSHWEKNCTNHCTITIISFTFATTKEILRQRAIVFTYF